MHSGFPRVREVMSFHRCFRLPRPEVPPDARAEAAEMLALWEVALSASGGPFLFGGFGGVDAMFAPAVVRLMAFDIPTGESPRTAPYMEAVRAHPAVRAWLGPAEALPPPPDRY